MLLCAALPRGRCRGHCHGRADAPLRRYDVVEGGALPRPAGRRASRRNETRPAPCALSPAHAAAVTRSHGQSAPFACDSPPPPVAVHRGCVAEVGSVHRCGAVGKRTAERRSHRSSGRTSVPLVYVHTSSSCVPTAVRTWADAACATSARPLLLTRMPLHWRARAPQAVALPRSCHCVAGPLVRSLAASAMPIVRCSSTGLEAGGGCPTERTGAGRPLDVGMRQSLRDRDPE